MTSTPGTETKAKVLEYPRYKEARQANRKLAGAGVVEEVCVEAKGIDNIGFRGHCKNLALTLNEKRSIED